MKRQKFLLVYALIVCLLFIPVNSQAQSLHSIKSFVTGTTAGTAQTVFGGVGSVQNVFNGVLNITSFAAQNGVLRAIGTISGTLNGAEGNVLQTVNNIPVIFQVIGMHSTCQMIAVTLGPLDVDVGSTVRVNQTVLNISAQSGGLGGLLGSLLGNLVCSVTDLLNNTVNLAGLADSIAPLLNQILGQL